MNVVNVLKAIKQSIKIKSSLGDVFYAITSSEEMEQWMGEQTIMNARVNGHFVFWNGKVVGINQYISLRSLVQEWKFKEWKQYSTVTLNLIEDRRQGITELEVIQEEAPEKSEKDLLKFWEKQFLSPLKTFLEKK